MPRFAIAPLGLTTEGSTKFKLKGWKCYLKNYSVGPVKTGSFNQSAKEVLRSRKDGVTTKLSTHSQAHPSERDPAVRPPPRRLGVKRLQLCDGGHGRLPGGGGRDLPRLQDGRGRLAGGVDGEGRQAAHVEPGPRGSPAIAAREARRRCAWAQHHLAHGFSLSVHFDGSRNLSAGWSVFLFG